MIPGFRWVEDPVTGVKSEAVITELESLDGTSTSSIVSLKMGNETRLLNLNISDVNIAHVGQDVLVMGVEVDDSDSRSVVRVYYWNS